MSTSIYSILRADLRRILLSTPGLPGNIAWEGRLFEPVPGVRWLREQLVTADSNVATLGGDGETQEDFIYVVTPFFPVATSGLSELEDLADAIRYEFNSGIRVGIADVLGAVIRCDRSPLMVEAEWWSIAIRVFCFARRKTMSAALTP